jgi:hypothetical protein
VSEDDDRTRDLAALVVPLMGSLQETGDSMLPCRIVDPNGEPVEAVSAYFGDLQAAGRSVATIRSYGLDLLRWFRFLWAIGVGWNRATRVEARDFCRWMLLVGKPARPHWRRPHEVPDRSGVQAPQHRRPGQVLRATSDRDRYVADHRAPDVGHLRPRQRPRQAAG